MGPERRTVIVAIAGALCVVGGAMWLTTSAPLRIAGGFLALLGVLMFTSLLWGQPFLSMHAKVDPERERRVTLGGLLRAAAIRLEYLGEADWHNNPQWFLGQFTDRSNATCDLIDQSLGPELADGYSEVQGDGSKGTSGMRSDAAAKAVYVRGLLNRIDLLPLMEDWPP